MAAYALYEPVNTLKPVADNVWIVDGPEIRMTYPWLPMFSVPFPTRMTIVRLATAVCGCIRRHRCQRPWRRPSTRSGKVAFLVAPNLLHFWWIADWKARYPQARAYAAPGAREHAQKRFTGFDADLTDEPPPEWQDEFAQIQVAGGFMTEVVFFHRPSRTLILTDLIENFEPDRFSKRWLRLPANGPAAATPTARRRSTCARPSCATAIRCAAPCRLCWNGSRSG